MSEAFSRNSAPDAADPYGALRRQVREVWWLDVGRRVLLGLAWAVEAGLAMAVLMVVAPPPAPAPESICRAAVRAAARGAACGAWRWVRPGCALRAWALVRFDGRRRWCWQAAAADGLGTVLDGGLALAVLWGVGAAVRRWVRQRRAADRRLGSVAWRPDPAWVRALWQTLTRAAVPIPESAWGPAAACVLDVLLRHADLPASVGFHDRDPGGLLRHSLSALRAAAPDIERLFPDPLERRAAVAAVLGHDVGKVVTIRPGRDGSVRMEPGHERVSAVILAHALAADPDLERRPDLRAAVQMAVVTPRTGLTPPEASDPLLRRLLWVLRCEGAAIEADRVVLEAAGGPPAGAEAVEALLRDVADALRPAPSGTLPPAAFRQMYPDQRGLKAVFDDGGERIEWLVLAEAYMQEVLAEADIEWVARAAGGFRADAEWRPLASLPPGDVRRVAVAWRQEGDRERVWPRCYVLPRAALAADPEVDRLLRSLERHARFRTLVRQVRLRAALDQSQQDLGDDAQARRQEQESGGTHEDVQAAGDQAVDQTQGQDALGQQVSRPDQAGGKPAPQGQDLPPSPHP